jgi:hypothetical protein
MNWLHSHVYIAVWASLIIALIGLMIRSRIRPSRSVNWSMLVIYVVCLASVAMMFAPGVEFGTRYLATTVGSMAFGYIVVDAMWTR